MSNISLVKKNKCPKHKGYVYYLYIEGFKEYEVTLDIDEKALAKFNCVISYVYNSGKASRTKEISKLLGINNG